MIAAITIWYRILHNSEGQRFTDDAQIDYESTGSGDPATRGALYLDAYKHRPDVSLSADISGFVQERLADSHVGR